MTRPDLPHILPRVLTAATSPDVHPTAIVDSRVALADGVRVGAYCVIEGRVRLGANTVVEPHSVIRGHTVTGAGCRVGPAAYVGLDPQHVRFDPAAGETSLVIGDGVVIREGTSVHRSLKPGEANATRVGDRCYLMAASHVAHDCRLGSDVILANSVLLGGHVEIGERSFLGGGSVFHQFVRIGRLAIVRGNEAVSKDIPPFSAAAFGGLKAYNAVGCRRAGMTPEGVKAIRAAYQCIHTNRTMPDAVRAIRAIEPQTPELGELLDFIAATKRGVQPSIYFLDRTIDDAED
jgi:UDP-N-acetylglucosamine acyltransferase